MGIMKKNKDYPKQQYLTHQDLYKHKAWFLCKQIIEKSNISKCSNCNNKENIKLFHIKCKNKYPKLIFDIFNLQYLCNICCKDKLINNGNDYRDYKFLDNLKEYIKDNNIKYKRIKFSISIKKLLFTYPKDYTPIISKDLERINIPIKQKPKRYIRIIKSNSNDYLNSKLDPKLDIGKILNLQASPGSE